MSEGYSEKDPKKRFVTNGELQEELEKKPSRWEVRLLILGAIVANQALPSVHISSGKTAQAFHLVAGLFV